MLNFFRLIKLRWRLLLGGLCIRLGISKSYVHFVGSTEALPPPLTKDEEKFLMEKLKKGDEAVKQLLIEHNLRLVVYIGRKFENTGINIEDLVSIGTIGLIKAVNTFDPEKKIKLATYASKCIENEILMYLRRNNKIKSEVSFDEPLNIDWDGNELLLSDVLGTDADLVHQDLEQEVNRELLSKALIKLSKREQKIMILRFGLTDGVIRTQKDVAQILGISQSYISRLEKKIISRLQKEIKKME
ncbi:RNA polymerase sporulation sigma factor SigE [Proteinivorax hydrogeniformans]|uniref:RNA polymerase sigma factor n=1 Tax=Proteinivorax hydrogeniformans TaxID=1826727 RepID=A0AAU8HPM1_9FIRM